MLRRRTSGALIALLLLMVAVPARAAGLVDPRLQFRQFRTAHFIIYFHKGEERMAARLAAIAEDVRVRARQQLGLTPPPLTHVVLADQTELSNGWASPLPRDTVFLNAAVPSGAEPIGWATDWLGLVFAHEYTHIVHLDRSRNWARVVRAVFGRTPLAFPNLWLPQWQIEGLATYEESRISPRIGGRENAGEFRAFGITPAIAGRPLKLDQVNGGLVAWPGGNAAYSAGMTFHQYLGTRMPTEDVSFGPLAEATAGRFPFTASPVFKRLFGASLGSLWSDYQHELASDRPGSPEGPSLPRPTRLTHQGNTVAGPRFAPAACDGCALDIVYSSRTPHEFPSLRAVHADGTGDGVVANRYLGDTSGTSARYVVFDQQEIRRNVGVYSDLYVLDRHRGSVRALTEESRIQDPDLAADGVSIVAVRETDGRRELIVGRLRQQSGGETLEAIESLLSADDTQYSTPRWSPDGRRVVAERRRLGALPEVIVVDVASRSISHVFGDGDTRIVTPTWRPDGQAVIGAADFGGHNWELFEFLLDQPGAARQLTRDTGALWPDLSPDGRTIVFAGYTVDGYDLFTQPYPAASAGPTSVALHPEPVQRPPIDSELELPPSSRYSPLGTLAPTTWSPLMSADSTQVRIGAAVAGFDLLGRHAYAADVTWLAARPSALVAGEPAGPDWDAVYSYNRWRPSLFVSASRQTTFVGALDSTGRRVDLALAQRDTQAGVFMPFIHVRHTEQLFASAVRSEDRYSFPGAPSPPALLATRLGVAESTAKIFGYSISPERGMTAGATTEVSRRTLGSVGDATTSTVDVRAYIPGARLHHVIAVRAGAGIADGDDSARQRFTLGGAHASSTVLDFGSGALGLLRGFPQGAFWGDRLAVANLEYRFPLATIERGHGTLPFFVRTVYASVFSDAGRTWDRGRDTGTWKSALGGELSANIVAGYALPLSATIGAAWGRDGTASRGLTVYARLGRAF